ncbi:Arc family DNA-binding protein [Anaerosporobacter sp.]|uniref:Arc family DNA-binding protein n=1 Tax=Anaerosporobacter sp. TaxID=1872529 RepID=UPI00286F7697|nr:Arc family DNA-binding protein [Anaerosporobacter sp.]
MPFQLSKFTLRIDSELLKKFRFVADYNARSVNREMEVLIKKHVNEFEEKHGNINQV